jgi:hypothetical protein
MSKEQDDLTAKQKDYAVFLPAISGFYATFIGKQRQENYVDPARFPVGLTDMEELNWLNDQKAMFPYKWSLYSGGHANLDLTKEVSSEDMVRKRDPNTLVLGDSGGFQIAKGMWEGEWHDPTGPEVAKKKAKLKGDKLKAYQKNLDAAQKKREEVLTWLDTVSNYCMTLDIPTWVINNPEANNKIGDFRTPQALVNATKYNNEYFMKNRKGIAEGGTKILNVLQGANHHEAEQWYQTMKDYCDPNVYPDTHFNGWAMGGQNMCDVELVLKRIIALKYDGLLQEGVHDWMHFLGTSRLEWAVLLTVIQRNVRKYINPKFTISFDCASPFLATANGQVYNENTFPNNGKWVYHMGPSVDDKNYSNDTRQFSQGVVQDKKYTVFTDSPISKLLTMKDICIYKPGVPKAGVTIDENNFQDPEMYDVLPDVNKNGKWGRTSWDSFSYALLMGHNVWMHLTAVQEANRRFDAGDHPAMMRSSGPGGEYFEELVESIFAAPTREDSEAIIRHYSKYWMEVRGTRGASGKKAFNSSTNYYLLFEEVSEQHDDDEPELDESKLNDLEENQ